MEDIFNLIKGNEYSFKHFRQWLFDKLGKNQKSFRTFGTYPNRLKIPYLIEYLEHREVPILDSLCYHNALSSNQAQNYEELCAFTIKEEFKRLNQIEQIKQINYEPF